MRNCTTDGDGGAIFAFSASSGTFKNVDFYGTTTACTLQGQSSDGLKNARAGSEVAEVPWLPTNQTWLLKTASSLAVVHLVQGHSL